MNQLLLQSKLRAGKWKAACCAMRDAQGLLKARRRRNKVEAALARVERRVARAVRAALERVKARIKDVMVRAYAPHAAKADDAAQRIIDDLMAQVDANGVGVAVVDALGDELRAIFRKAGLTGVAEVGFTATSAIVHQVDTAAVAYAAGRGAALVTQIAESTRDSLRDLTTEAVENGWSTDDFASAIEDAVAFSPDRAKMVARTELAFAHVGGNLEGWRASGEVESKVWLASADACPVCEALDGTEVGLGETFDYEGEAIDGPPGHPNCFLPGSEVGGRFVAGSRFWYSGPVVSMRVEGRKQLTVTANHPVLTRRGWVTAAALRPGDEVLCDDPVGDGEPVAPGDYVDQMPARIEDVFDALRVRGFVVFDASRMASDAFHGDVKFGHGDVYVVGSERVLLGDFDAQEPDGGGDGVLVVSAMKKSSRVRDGAGTLDGEAVALTSATSSGAGCLARARGGVHAGPLDALRIGLAAQLDAVALKNATEGLSADVQLVGELLQRFPARVSFRHLSDVRHGDWSGHVYDLQSETGFIVSETIIVSNCRCDVLPVLKPNEEE